MVMAIDTLAVLIDDDDASARLTSMSLSASGIEVVRRDSIAEALPILPLLEPDVVLTDLPGGRPGDNPLHALRSSFAAPIFVISAWRENSAELEQLAPGAAAYFSKPFEPLDLEHQLANLIERNRRTREEAAALTKKAKEIQRHLQLRRERFLRNAANAQQVRAAGAIDRGGYGLSPREIEVLVLLVGGLSDGDIAARLGITRNTASNHVGAIREKLNARSRTEVAVRAIREGLVSAPWSN
jgi:DNA-binding NarL/FixJ family response regulator